MLLPVRSRSIADRREGKILSLVAVESQKVENWFFWSTGVLELNFLSTSDCFILELFCGTIAGRQLDKLKDECSQSSQTCNKVCPSTAGNSTQACCTSSSFSVSSITTTCLRTKSTGEKSLWRYLIQLMKDNDKCSPAFDSSKNIYDSIWIPVNTT